MQVDVRDAHAHAQELGQHLPDAQGQGEVGQGVDLRVYDTSLGVSE